MLSLDALTPHPLRIASSPRGRPQIQIHSAGLDTTRQMTSRTAPIRFRSASIGRPYHRTSEIRGASCPPPKNECVRACAETTDVTSITRTRDHIRDTASTSQHIVLVIDGPFPSLPSCLACDYIFCHSCPCTLLRITCHRSISRHVFLFHHAVHVSIRILPALSCHTFVMTFDSIRVRRSARSTPNFPRTDMACHIHILILPNYLRRYPCHCV